MFEDNDQTPFEEEQPAEESSNRNFFIIAGILISIVCISIAGLGYYAVRVIPQQASARSTAEQAQVEQNVQAMNTLTALAQIDILSQTPNPTATLPPTNTPVIAPQASATAAAGTPNAASTSDPQTATVAAALTQAAQAQLTVTFLPTSTALPTSGFADEAGLPGLVAMAIALVVVILLARRLRAAPTAR